MKVKQFVTRLIESSQHIYGQEKKGGSLRSQRSEGGSAHAHDRKTQLSKDKNIVDANVGAREDDRSRDQRGGLSRTHQQGAVSKVRPDEENSPRRDLEIVVDEDSHPLRFDKPFPNEGPGGSEGRRDNQRNEGDGKKALVEDGCDGVCPPLAGAACGEDLDGLRQSHGHNQK